MRLSTSHCNSVRIVLVCQSEVLRHRWLDLHLHLVVHVALGFASAAVNDHDIDQDQSNDDTYDQSSAYASVLDLCARNYALFVQSFQTDIRSIGEAGADSIENTQWLNLSTVGFLVDDDWRVDVCAKFFPVIDLLLNIAVFGRDFSPAAFWNVKETFLDAFLGFIKVNFKVFVRPSWAVFVNYRVARRVDLPDVAPPFERLIGFSEVVPEAHLAKIFEHDVSTLDVRVWRLNRAVGTTTITVVLKILFVAVSALPENVARAEIHFRAKLLLNFLEVFEEVNSSIGRRSEPEVNINIIVHGHYELAHQDQRIALIWRCIFDPIYQFVAVILANQHRGDSDTTTGAIVAHKDLINHLGSIVNDDGDSDTDVLHIADFLNEGALTTTHNHERCDIISAVNLDLWLIDFVACVLVLREIVQFSHDSLPIRNEAEVGVVSPHSEILELFCQWMWAHDFETCFSRDG